MANVVTFENLWKFLGNICDLVATFENLWHLETFWKILEIISNLWQSVADSGRLWQSV